MKRHLLTWVLAICGMAGAMAATWEAPTAVASDLQYGETMYFYNVSSSQFISAFGGSALLAVKGSPIVATQGEDDDVYLQVDGLWLYYKDEDVLVANEQPSEDCTWNLIRQDNGTYRIRPDKDNVYYGSGVWPDFWTGWQNDGTTHIWPLLFNDELYGLDWIILSAAAYHDFEAKNNLNLAMTEAQSLGLAIDDALAIYNNVGSTNADYEAATAALNAVIQQYRIEHASITNPVDVTYLIKNQSFDEGWEQSKNEIVGWENPQGAFTYSGDNLFGDTRCIGRWAFPETGFSDAKLYQRLKGLPVGKYSLTAEVICIDQDQAETEEDFPGYYHTDGNTFYAAAEMDTYTTNLSTGSRWGAETKMIDAIFVTDGTLEIGVEMKNSTANWFVMNNVRLIYYGQNALKDELQGYVDTAKELLEEPQMNHTYTDALTAAVEAAEALIADSEATIEAISAATATLQAALTSAQANVEAYLAFRQQFAQTEEVMSTLEDHLDIKEVKALEEYIDYIYDNIYDHLEDFAYTTEQLEEMIQEMLLLTEVARHALIEPGTDVTAYILNPGFDSGVDGWDLDGEVGEGKALNTTDQSLIEAYDKNFTLSQTLLGMPNGVYTFTVQLCQRTTWNCDWLDQQWTDPDAREAEIAKINLFAFLNAQSARALHIFEADPETFTQEEADQLWHTWLEPNSQMAIPAFAPSARMFFDRDQYTVELTGLVVDGTLRFGIQSKATSDRLGWFDNAKLVFNGPDATQARDLMDQVVAEAEALLESTMQGTIRKAIEDAIAQARTANDFDAYCQAIVALNKATAPAEASIAAYVRLENALASHEATATNADITETESGKLYAAYYDEVKAEYQNPYPAYDEAAITAAIQKLEELLAAARLEVKFHEGEDITRLLTNPSFEDQTGLGSGVSGVFNPPFGWHFLIDGKECTTAEEMAEAGLNSFCSPDQNIDCTDGEYGYCLQTAPFPDVYMYQTVSGLPQGTYEVSMEMVVPYDLVDGEDYYRLAGQRLLVNNRAMYYGHSYDYIEDKLQEYHPYETFRDFGENDEVCATTSPIGDKGPLSHLSVQVSIPEGGSITLGVRTDGLWDATTKTFESRGWTNYGWCKFDDFRLKCISFQYDPTLDAIEEVESSELKVESYFDLNGRRIGKMQRGVNIVRRTMSDGTVRTQKVIIR